VRLLDTDILIDIQRNHLPAVQWFASLTELPEVPGFVVMELIQGAPTAQHQRTAFNFHGETAMTDDEHVQAFESLALPLVQWTHRAHVRVAFTYLHRHPFNIALEKMRSGVKKYNAFHDVPEIETSGYNETTTHAFMHLVLATLHAYGKNVPTPTADAFCDTHPQLMTRHALRLFYSPERRMHPLAKTQFIEPDLSPLPRICNPEVPPDC
jgi:hypothetical protein